MKKQGVSGQSVAVSRDITITKHNKDFRSRTIIKEAIMENDFLKNLSQGQVGSRDNHHYPRHTLYGAAPRGNTVTVSIYQIETNRTFFSLMTQSLSWFMFKPLPFVTIMNISWMGPWWFMCHAFDDTGGGWVNIIIGLLVTVSRLPMVICKYPEERRLLTESLISTEKQFLMESVKSRIKVIFWGHYRKILSSFFSYQNTILLFVCSNWDSNQTYLLTAAFLLAKIVSSSLLSKLPLSCLLLSC